MSDPLPDPAAFVPRLPTRVVGQTMRVLDEVSSTNTYALDQGTDGMVVVAERQTAGRGRHGRAWHSARGLGLWFSVAFDGPPLEGLACGAALAVRAAVAPRCRLTVKWPNDLLADGKKVCGILTEQARGRTALGIGINVHHRPEDFQASLRDTAGSLAMATGTAWNRTELLQDVLTHLDGQVMRLRSGQVETVRRAWAAACGLEGRRIRCGGLVGTVAAIDTEGGLVLDTPAGVRRVVAGDIALADGV